MRNRPLWPTLIWIALTALLFGCTSAHGSGTPDDESGAPVPAYGRTDINAKPPAELKQGGTLTLPIYQWLTQFNYFQVDGAWDDVSTVMSLLEPRLFARDAVGTPHPVPDYLRSASVTSSAPQTVVYRLNPEARWSDGKPLSWRDFAAQWHALGSGDQRYRIVDPSGYEDIASIRQGADKHQVKVTFKRPFADWQRLFTPLYPAAAYSTPAQFNDGWRKGAPITAGPFRIGSLDATAQTLTAVPDPRWWGTRPRLDRIVLRTLDPATAVQAFLNGELDAVNAASADLYDRLRDADDTDIRTGSAWDDVQVALNGAAGPLADPEVRRAVLKAIDRQALAKVAGTGLPVGVPLLGNHFFMTNQPGYKDNSGTLGTYDLKDAERILEQRGWHRDGNSGTRTRNGQNLTLRFVLSQATNRLGLDLSQLLQQMLRQAGIQVEIQKVPADDYLPKYLNSGNFDLAIFRFTGLTYPSTLYPVYREPSGEQIYENYGRISSPEVDRLLDRAVHTLDAGRRNRLYNQADRLIWQLGHDVLLYQRPQVLAVRRTLANYGVPGLGDTDFTAVGWER
ncbi:ABC transporter family substrate-binding protein [Streptomyces cylindrosporus]|uniref:ABC transporter family substrate-binding protein n=1 Tax=Streptomyces cylindrosporus TaxID=2927583 RepID=A0ABS9YEP9_9ACTN|nr:ABC transporter family substrate-binding protein [Streptomyces cylindrosporus]MCI3275704.1 ABC transporter family substrate-binding protein [Streptomyces cylindrosporus]